MTSQPEGMGKIMHLGTQKCDDEILPLTSSLQNTERDGDEAQIAVSPNPAD